MRVCVTAVSFASILIASQALAQTTPAPAPQTPPRPPAQTAPPAPPPQAAPRPPMPFPQGAKIAFVNLQQIAAISADGKAADARVRALLTKKQNEAGEKAKQLQANQQKLETSRGVMSDAARTQLEKDIERQQREAERFEQDAQAELQELQRDLQAELEKKLAPVIEAVAKEKGLQALVRTETSGIIWADPGLDLTEEVVKKMDVAAGAKPAAPPKP